MTPEQMQQRIEELEAALRRMVDLIDLLMPCVPWGKGRPPWRPVPGAAVQARAALAKGDINDT